jgi:hypothetical protein
MLTNLKVGLLILASGWALSGIVVQTQLYNQSNRIERLEVQIKNLQQTVDQARRPGL